MEDIPGFLLVILEAIMSSSKIALLILHGCALYLFASSVLWKAKEHEKEETELL